MGKSNSSSFKILIPDSFGAYSRTAPLEQADLTDINDTIPGQLQSIFYTIPALGGQVETYRYRTGAPSTLGISVAESAAGFLKKFRDNDCMMVVQRKRCIDNLVQHYGRFQLNTLTRSNTTAQGINATDSVSLATFPGVFGTYHEFTDSKPKFAGNTEKGEIIDVVICDCAECCSGSDGCQRAYRLILDTNTNEDFVLQTTDNCGITWTLVTTGIEISGRIPTAMHCFNGRLFLGFQATFPGIGSNDEIFFSDTPLVTGSWVQADVSSIFGPFVGRIQVNGFSHWGKTIYALFSRDDLVTFSDWGVARSIDYGETWDLGFATGLVLPTGFEMHDIASAGRNVAMVGDLGTFILSEDYGEPGSWTQNAIIASGLSKFVGQPNTAQIVDNIYAVGMWNPDFRDLSCTVTLIVDRFFRIFVTSDNNNWQQVWEDCFIGDRLEMAKMEVAADGWLIWIHGRLNGGGQITLKNIGDQCWLRSSTELGDVIDVLACNVVDGDLVLTLEHGCNDFVIGEQVTITLDDETEETCEILDIIDSNVILGNCTVLTPAEICIVGVDFILCGDIAQTTGFAMCPQDPDISILVTGIL